MPTLSTSSKEKLWSLAKKIYGGSPPIWSQSNNLCSIIDKSEIQTDLESLIFWLSSSLDVFKRKYYKIRKRTVRQHCNIIINTKFIYFINHKYINTKEMFLFLQNFLCYQNLGLVAESVGASLQNRNFAEHLLLLSNVERRVNNPIGVRL